MSQKDEYGDLFELDARMIKILPFMWGFVIGAMSVVILQIAIRMIP